MEIGPWLADPAAATRLAEAYAALAKLATQAFGLAVPDDVPDRDALRGRALELLKQWLAQLDAEGKERIRAQLAGYGVPVALPAVKPDADA